MSLVSGHVSYGNLSVSQSVIKWHKYIECPHDANIVDKNFIFHQKSEEGKEVYELEILNLKMFEEYWALQVRQGSIINYTGSRRYSDHSTFCN